MTKAILPLVFGSNLAYFPYADKLPVWMTGMGRKMKLDFEDDTFVLSLKLGSILVGLFVMSLLI